MAPRCFLWAMSVPRINHELKLEDIFPKRTDGKCRCGCEVKLKGRQRSWASDACGKKAVAEYEFQKGYSAAVRARVFARDMGVCAQCGMDTEKEQAACLYWWDYKVTDAEHEKNVREMHEKRERFMRLGYPSPSETWWQADHIIPLIEGGPHTLENLRTLCVTCHKQATRDLAKRRAAARKALKVARMPLLAGL